MDGTKAMYGASVTAPSRCGRRVESRPLALSSMRTSNGPGCAASAADGITSCSQKRPLTTTPSLSDTSERIEHRQREAAGLEERLALALRAPMGIDEFAAGGGHGGQEAPPVGRSTMSKVSASSSGEWTITCQPSQTSAADVPFSIRRQPGWFICRAE